MNSVILCHNVVVEKCYSSFLERFEINLFMHPLVISQYKHLQRKEKKNSIGCKFAYIYLRPDSSEGKIKMHSKWVEEGKTQHSHRGSVRTSLKLST